MLNSATKLDSSSRLAVIKLLLFTFEAKVCMRREYLIRITKYLVNAPFGFFLGITFTCTLGLIFDANFSENMTRFYTFVGSSLVSLLVATFAVAGVLANIESQRERDAEQRSRRLLALVGRLPLALTEMAHQSQAAIEYASRSMGEYYGQRHESFASDNMKLSDETLGAILQVIEHHDHETVANLLVCYLQSYQTNLARWLSPDNGSLGPKSQRRFWKARTVEWCQQRAIVSCLFDYARTGSIRMPTREDFLAALMENWDLVDPVAEKDFERDIEGQFFSFERSFRSA